MAGRADGDGTGGPEPGDELLQHPGGGARDQSAGSDPPAGAARRHGRRGPAQGRVRPAQGYRTAGRRRRAHPARRPPREPALRRVRRRAGRIGARRCSIRTATASASAPRKSARSSAAMCSASAPAAPAATERRTGKGRKVRPMAAGKMHLLGFMMYTPINHMTLSWADPEDRQVEGFGSMEHWQDLARTMERGRFDGLFFAERARRLRLLQGHDGCRGPARGQLAGARPRRAHRGHGGGDPASRHRGDRLGREPAPVPDREVALQPGLPDRRPRRMEYRHGAMPGPNTGRSGST